jgi:small subunit ribosomal protein S1
LHVTDISWKRINHPSEALQIGESVQVKVIKFNDETQRISLGIKQLTEDPWLKVFERFPIGSKMTGIVTNITDYGSFVELEDGIEGLVHVTEMSWTKKNVHPGKIVSTSEKVEVMVLEIDVQKRRISLGIKQCIDNPWEKYKSENKIGDTIEGEIRNITEFGLFVGLTEDIDGLVHLSDISWDGNGDEMIKDFSKGASVKAKILDIDVEKERVSLGIKQLTEDVTSTELGNLSKGSIVTCTISNISEKGLDVSVGDNLSGFIKRGDLARERSDQKTERFGVGDKIDAMITNIDKKLKKITLSIKAKEIEEEKKVMEEYGSSDSGASLGDILGAALAKKDEDSSK